MMESRISEETTDVDHSLPNVLDMEQEFDSDSEDNLKNEKALKFDNRFGTSTSESFQSNQGGSNLVPTPDLVVVDQSLDKAGDKEFMKLIFQTRETKVSDEILSYIDSIIYPKILLGNVEVKEKYHSQLKALGKLSPREQKFFQFVNTVLQYPPCVVACNKKWKPDTQKAYTYQIARYVLFTAKNTGGDVSDFTVDGKLMLHCLEDMFQIVDVEPTSRRNKVTPSTILIFKSALLALQMCLGIFKTACIKNNQKRSTELVSSWYSIPDMGLVNQFCQEKIQTLRNEAKGKCWNKNRAEMFHKKYTILDCKRMMINMLELTGSRKKKDIYDGINANLEFLLGHHLLFRGLNKLALELSDSIYSVEKTSHGSVPILGFQFEIENNLCPNSNPGILGVCRNKNVEICLISSFAMSLWYRFDFHDLYGPLSGKNSLNFLDKRSWYDPKVLFASSSESKLHQPISSSYASKLVSMCLSSIGMESSKKTYIGRDTNSARANACLVNESQIRRAGRWNLDVLQSAHISSYAHEFIHFSAGFKATEPYYIPRNIEVPEELQLMIFPWLEKAIQDVNNRTDQEHLSVNERDGTAPLFLEMLRQFRSIILQDLTLLVDLAPNSIYSTHPITNNPLFHNLKARVANSLKNNSIFSDTPEMQDVADILAPVIGLKIDIVKMGIDVLNSNQLRHFQKLNDQIPIIIRNYINNDIHSMFTDLSSKQTDKLLKHLHVQAKKDFLALTERIEMIEKNILDKLTSMQLNMDVKLGFLEEFCSVAEIPSNSQSLDDEYSDARKRKKRESNSRYHTIPKTVENRFKTREFQMLPKNISICSLLEEYFISKPGSPSILERDKVHGAKWRYDQSSLWKYKKTFVNFVCKIAKDVGVDRQTVGQIIDELAEKDQHGGLAALRTKILDIVLENEVAEDIVKILNESKLVKTKGGGGP